MAEEIEYEYRYEEKNIHGGLYTCGCHNHICNFDSFGRIRHSGVKMMMLKKKLEMISYIHGRDRRRKFMRSDYKFTSRQAMIKAEQLLWRINSKYLPLLQNASYCYCFVWTSGEKYEDKKYYVVDIYDNNAYARILENPADIYSAPEFKDKVSYPKLYNNINRIVKNFLSQTESEEQYEQSISFY